MNDIEEKCSKHFSYSDLIKCGETFQRDPTINNIPQSNETFEAIASLCQNILDPIQERFGEVILTYGFASNNLTKKINKNIYPKLDQHSGYEKNSKGVHICKRLGLACDFYIEKIDMNIIAKFIIENLPFDRLYFYESDRPIHVSIGPENKKLIVKMTKYNNRKVPKVVKQDYFL